MYEMAFSIIGTDVILLCIECESLDAMGMGRIIYNFRYEIRKRCISRFGFLFYCCSKRFYYVYNKDVYQICN